MKLIIHDSEKYGTGETFNGDTRQDVMDDLQGWLAFYSSQLNADDFLGDVAHEWSN
jgi:Zn/Cd-binding protein ZinT